MSSLLSVNLQFFYSCVLRGSAPSAFGGFPRGFWGPQRCRLQRRVGFLYNARARIGEVRLRVTAKMFATARCGLAAVRRLRMCDRLSLTQLPVLGV